MIDSSTANKILFCGLPSSGKTTFLAALSYQLESGELNSIFKLKGLPNERTFLNVLADKWVNCSTMLRTEVSSSEHISMHVETNNDLDFIINMPDFSGEKWQALWDEHEIDDDLMSELTDHERLVLFVQADNINVPISILDEAEILSDNQEANVEVNSHSAKWEPNKHVPTQVIIVDMLRKIASLSKSKHLHNLAIVVSAWDTVDDKIEPEQFLKKELPLLAQYIECKFDYENVKVFGVSAQGGDLTNIDSKKNLLHKDCPSKRVMVRQGDNKSSDLTLILSWLLIE
ncbi:hypothetical protein [Pseudoalteromonas prydzensis]|uniref:TRAFAC clade GTPase domain-containing protein n=1 Tax=Pseudoalteromonas prydzensis TaxID=182141 RepID=UPI0024BBEC7E|nr:hypothetical protein [Pseudoalteromonas prydzensis]